MSNSIIIIALGAMLVCLFIKVPVFASVMAGAVSYFVLSSSTSQVIIVQRIVSGIQSIPLLAIPFFVCAGVFMNYSGVTRRIMDFCAVITGRMVGGLAQVNVLLSTMMGGLSGSNLADAAMEAKMLVPEMERNGYSKEFSSVVTAFSSVITPLIPPGIGMILYGSIANVSVGRLFVSGIGVGLILCFSLMILVSRISKKRGYLPIRTEKISSKDFWKALKGAFFPLLLPVIIIGGIRIGVITPTESGSVAIVYSLLLGLFYRELKWEHIVKGLKETVITTASIFLIVGAASALSWALTKEQIPQALAGTLTTVISNKYVFFLAVNVFLLLLGMFLEGNAITIVLVPLLAPIARSYGISDIQFAMMFIFNISIGALTPPMGTLMFVTCGITGCKIKAFIKEAIPFFAFLLLILLILTFIPAATTGLVDLIY